MCAVREREEAVRAREREGPGAELFKSQTVSSVNSLHASVQEPRSTHQFLHAPRSCRPVLWNPVEKKLYPILRNGGSSIF